MSNVPLNRNQMAANREQATNRLFLAIVPFLLTFMVQTTRAQTFTVLHDFTNGKDGGIPFSTLVRDQAGNLYGTTSQGGDISNCDPSQGCGTVFKISPAGKETVLYEFNNTHAGVSPRAGVVRDSAGNLYGTTELGGTSNMGTVFKLEKGGKETVLYSFTGRTDGGNPLASVILGADGNLYGTTYIGGDLSCQVGQMNGCGVVFKLAQTGKLTVLHRFHGTDGANPSGALVRDESGNLYGTTYGGAVGGGTVFEVNSAGKRTTLHIFRGNDGADPIAGLLRDSSGNLYGTTYAGGSAGGGTVFKVSNTGKESVLYSFTLGTDGGRPGGSLTRDADGNFYGTTSLGGDLSCNGGDGCGTVFKLDKAGTETVLHEFKNESDGGFPQTGLLRDASGDLYGTTPGNFQYTWGSVFKLTP